MTEAETERAKIVAWVRAQVNNCGGGIDYRNGFNDACHWLAMKIEQHSDSEGGPNA